MKAKIFVAYHKKSVIIKNKILEPIHVGRDLHTDAWFNDNMQGDNLGDNISLKNNRYCELTAQYYAWKNYDKIGSPDYIGFFHYRRFLNFNLNSNYNENLLSNVEYPFIDENYQDLFGLNEENILNVIKDYDLITLKPTNLSKFKHKTIYQQYKASHNIKDYNKAITVLLNKYPDFKKAVKSYNNSNYGYFTNTFIMKKELFKKYAEWLFSILFEVEDLIPEYKNAGQNRVMGFIAERLFGIYLTYLKEQNKIKIKELQQVFVQSNDKTISLAFACDNNYSIHLSSAITSILQNADKNDKFNIYIINTKKNLNYINKKLLSRLKNNNCQIKFITIDNIKFEEMPKTDCCKHISIETYYRFLLPEILPFHNKILYLDCDITVQKSLKELWQNNIENFYFAGVIDILNQPSIERLKLKKYCNAGVLLINLKKWREDNIQEKLFEYTLLNKQNIVWQDQDVLNTVLQDKIKYIDKTWNAQIGEYGFYDAEGFNLIGNDAHIIHYIGCDKPWLPNSKSPFKDVYFKYLNIMKLEYKLLFLYKSIKIHIKYLFKIIKNCRKKIIWYSKSNKNLILFNKIRIYIPF